MKGKFVSIVFSAVLLSACSSIVSKSEYSVAINSNPSGADFVVSNRAGQNVYSGVTPSSVTLKSSAGYFKGEAYTIMVSKEGYSSRTYTLRSSVDGWYWGNFLLGGAIGMLIVDPATGAMYKLPDRVDISIDPQAASTSSKNDLTIASIDSLSSEQIARLKRIK
jgi:hypothetical protein